MAIIDQNDSTHFIPEVAVKAPFYLATGFSTDGAMRDKVVVNSVVSTAETQHVVLGYLANNDRRGLRYGFENASLGQVAAEILSGEPYSRFIEVSSPTTFPNRTPPQAEYFVGNLTNRGRRAFVEKAAPDATAWFEISGEFRKSPDQPATTPSFLVRSANSEKATACAVEALTACGIELNSLEPRDTEWLLAQLEQQTNWCGVIYDGIGVGVTLPSITRGLFLPQLARSESSPGGV